MTNGFIVQKQIFMLKPLVLHALIPYEIQISQCLIWRQQTVDFSDKNVLKNKMMMRYKEVMGYELQVRCEVIF